MRGEVKGDGQVGCKRRKGIAGTKSCPLSAVRVECVKGVMKPERLNRHSEAQAQVGNAVCLAKRRETHECRAKGQPGMTRTGRVSARQGREGVCVCVCGGKAMM
jgi:ribosomal protein L35AE/L33A